jgi:hypothetical protein
MPAAANGPLGGSFGVAIAPERVVTGRHIAPFVEQKMGVETLGRLDVIVAPRGTSGITRT